MNRKLYTWGMHIKTVTWNIGGGKHLKEGDDPLLMASYSVDAISEIAAWLKGVAPDIITLQEAQGDDTSSQVEEIANLLGYEYYFYDSTSSSHIDADKTLGNGLISKYPITNHTKGVFKNPSITTVLQGTVATSHDKGYGRCDVTINDQTISVMTLHLLPFRAFSIDLYSEVGVAIRRSIEVAIPSDAPKLLVQGDFNIDEAVLKGIFPTSFADGLNEIVLENPTTPSGNHYDHVLYKGLSLEKMDIDSGVKTDHYPVICDFVMA